MFLLGVIFLIVEILIYFLFFKVLNDLLEDSEEGSILLGVYSSNVMDSELVSEY